MLVLPAWPWASAQVGERAARTASRELGRPSASTGIRNGGSLEEAIRRTTMVVSRLSVRDSFLNKRPYSTRPRKSWGFGVPPRPGFGVSLSSGLTLPGYGMDVHMAQPHFTF